MRKKYHTDEERKAARKVWSRRDYDKHRDRCTKHARRYYAANRGRHNAWVNQRNIEIKLEVLTHYGLDGTLRCCWPDCPVNDVDMLTLDHIEENGAQDRRENGTHSPYRRLIRNNFPSGFQTLCGGHQFKKTLMLNRERRAKLLQ